MKSLVVFVGSVFFASSMAVAYNSSGVLINASGLYYQANNINNSVTTTDARTLADGFLGYHFQFPVFVGGLYSYDNDSTTSGSTSSTYNYASYGATAGFDNGFFYLWGSYLIGSEYDSTTSGVKTAYTGGTGWMATIGYRFYIGNNFAVGPQISYRSLSYTTSQVGSAASTGASYSSNMILPYISLTYNFGGARGGGD